MKVATTSGKLSGTTSLSVASGPIGFGVRRRRNAKTLDVWFVILDLNTLQEPFSTLAPFVRQDNLGVTPLQPKSLRNLMTQLKRQAKMRPDHVSVRLALQTATAFATSKAKSGYCVTDLILFCPGSLEKTVASAEEAYFKLHLLSRRLKKPHEVNLDGLFSALANVAWSNHGPLLPEDVAQERIKYAFTAMPLEISHVDKFPYLVNYVIPDGVRIADAARVRLGAYLSPGTTVMPAGFVNFNAGTLGPAMVEGRVSAGVVVDADSDVGGGASIMGTLSGGGKEVIRVGRKSLVGANAGIGISLGSGCTVAAGLYVTAGAKVSLYDAQNRPINLHGQSVAEGKNIVKAKELSGRDNLLLYADSQTGKIICKPNHSEIVLNKILHT